MIILISVTLSLVTELVMLQKMSQEMTTEMTQDMSEKVARDLITTLAATKEYVSSTSKLLAAKRNNKRVQQTDATDERMPLKANTISTINRTNSTTVSAMSASGGGESIPDRVTRFTSSSPIGKTLANMVTSASVRIISVAETSHVPVVNTARKVSSRSKMLVVTQTVSGDASTMSVPTRTPSADPSPLPSQHGSYRLVKDIMYPAGGVIVIALLLIILCLVLHQRRKAIKNKSIQLERLDYENTHSNMGKLWDIDKSLDVSLEEQLQSLTRYPDVVCVLRVDSSKTPKSTLRKTLSVSNLPEVDLNNLHPRESAGLGSKRNTLYPYQGSQASLRVGSVTRLNYDGVKSHCDDILEFNKLEGRPIMVKELKQYIDKLTLNTYHNGNGTTFSEEYRAIPNNVAAPSHVSMLLANKPKNRYIDIRPYDHCRVVLEPLDDDVFSDYINASYIDGYGDRENAYIAMQAPKANTVSDMWRLVWQTEATFIVMLTNIVESGRQKCERYWPKDRTAKYGNIEVTTIAAEGFSFYVKRKFSIKTSIGSRVVTHLHFTNWPDHGVPKKPEEILDFFYTLNSLDKRRAAPWILHCSAGIGRTGSFIAIDYLLEQIRHEQLVDVFKCVSHMRLNRYQMVQTEAQYQFIYEVLHIALTNTNTGVPVDEFDDKACRSLVGSSAIVELVYKSQRQTFLDAGVLGCDGMKQENRHRNRDYSPVPPDDGRPHLRYTKDSTDYINAVFVDSYRKKRAFIATQLPLQNTKVDFWRMLCEYKCSSIVLLTNHINQDDIYWPEKLGEKLVLEKYTIVLVGIKLLLEGAVLQRDFIVQDITNLEKISNHMICQWHVTAWPTDSDTSTLGNDFLVSVNEFVEQWQRSCSSTSPVVVQCLHGVDRCDLYVTLCYVLQKMSSDGVVDIPFAIRQIRSNRPQFMTSLHHVRHICNVVLAVNSDDYADYAN